MSAYEHFAESIRHYAAQETDAALESARNASLANPDELLYQDAVRYLEKLRERPYPHAIYTQPDAFTAFISGGSNLPLYDSARRMLIDRLHAARPATLLDIGTGEGSIIIPVVSRMEHQPALTLCDPALALLRRAMDFAQDCNLEVDAYPYPIEDVLADPVVREWDAAVATWSLQNLPRSTRSTVLARLAGHVRHLYLAEFDDASGGWSDPLAPERVRHIHDRYLTGIQEYAGEEGRRVRLGFLLPVLYGYFTGEGKRSTYEQPIRQWEEELVAAGFTVLERSLIFPYWWADAYLITARGAL